MLYIVQVVYLFAIAMIKFSILLFYRRIFSIPSTRLPAYMIAAAVMGWLIATVRLSEIQSHKDRAEAMIASRWYLLLQASTRLLGQIRGIRMRQRSQILSGGRDPQHIDRCRASDLPTAFDLEAQLTQSAEDWAGRSLCSWWLVSRSEATFESTNTAFQLIFASIIVISSLRLVTVIESQEDLDITCKCNQLASCIR